MHQTGEIVSYRITEDGTDFVVHIPNVSLAEFISSKMSKSCGIWLEDGRSITELQRKKIYATVRDISEHTGYLPEAQKEWLKYLHIERTGCQYFSLSNCSVDTAREFINTILDFSLENGIILGESGLERTDDIGRYLYACLKHKKCCICGQVGDKHHVDTIGMGNNRKKVDDSNKEVIQLCRKHHREAHDMGNLDFFRKHKVYGIVIKDIEIKDKVTA